MRTFNFKNTALAIAVAGFALCGTASANSIYTFTGNCTDCDGTVTGTLILTDSGTTISLDDFVSFTYNGSNLFSPYTINAGDVTFISGSIPGFLPAPADFNVSTDTVFFFTSSDGNWDTGFSGNSDFGSSHNYSDASASVPEPATLGMLGVALGGLVYFRRRILSALR